MDLSAGRGGQREEDLFVFLFELVEKWTYPRVTGLKCGEILYVILLNFIVNFDISLIVLENADWEVLQQVLFKLELDKQVSVGFSRLQHFLLLKSFQAIFSNVSKFMKVKVFQSLGYVTQLHL